MKDHACVMFSIIGWGSVVGNWARIEGGRAPQPLETNPRVTVLGACMWLCRDVML